MKYYNTENYDNQSPKYCQRKSYLSATDLGDESLPYITLTDDYDIFSEVDQSFLYRNDTKQFELISTCFRFLRDRLTNLMKEDNKSGKRRTLPKVIMSENDNGAIAFNWAFSSFRATLLFESEEENNKAYCSIVAQKAIGSVFIQTDEVNENNYMDIMDMLLYSVIDNS